MSALRIEEGKFYKRRDGKVVGPAEWRADDGSVYSGSHPWWLCAGYTSDGRWSPVNLETEMDLIEEVPNPNRAIDNETLTTTFAPVEQIVDGFGDISAVPLGGWSGDEVLVEAMQSAGVSVPEENLVLPDSTSAKPVLQIEEGKHYKRRDGEVVGPAILKEDVNWGPQYPWLLRGISYMQSGRQIDEGIDSRADLIEEVPNPNVAAPTSVTRATDLAQTAANLVGGDRDRQHGQKRDNFTRIAAVWNAWLDIRKDKGAPLDAHDVGCMMAMMKLARTQSGKLNLDDYIDAAGYAACAGEVAQTSG